MTNNDFLESYARLGPDEILHAVESTGLSCDGRIFTLNSYENRVYQIGISDNDPVVVKFYRPNRWSDEQILEEHRFTDELADLEIPVITPVKNSSNKSLHHHEQYRFAIYQRCGGRPPELDDPEHLLQLGRFIARIHNVGEIKLFDFRPKITVKEFSSESCHFLLENNFIPADLAMTYESICKDLIIRIENCYHRAGQINSIRLHGDCHHGNILWRDNAPFILDFDDARSGPAVQDLWMFLSGDRPYMTARLCDLLEGYTEFRDFDSRELHIVEALRTLRMMYYAAWLARRWNDPAFPLAFPHFNTQHFWEEHILNLREQAALMDEPPLEWYKS